jgi:hypothetical protein
MVAEHLRSIMQEVRQICGRVFVRSCSSIEVNARKILAAAVIEVAARFRRVANRLHSLRMAL